MDEHECGLCRFESGDFCERCGKPLTLTAKMVVYDARDDFDNRLGDAL